VEEYPNAIAEFWAMSQAVIDWAVIDWLLRA
jgi:hypothetical protein